MHTMGCSLTVSIMVLSVFAEAGVHVGFVLTGKCGTKDPKDTRLGNGVCDDELNTGESSMVAAELLNAAASLFA